MSNDFGALGVPDAIVAALSVRGVTEPFPIQRATLPDSLAGNDVLGRGRTGSGKTIAFAIPVVTALARSGVRRRAGHPRALVLVPTRELANQVSETLTPLATAMGLRVTTVIGGVGQNPQVKALQAGVDVMVACPGRLEDLIQQRHCSLSQVEVTVLDEADHMADLGFLPSVKRLMDATPKDGQRLLFSATLDNGIDVLVRRYLSNPVTHSVDPAVAPVSTMTHHVFAVQLADKPQVVRELAAGHDRSLLFTRTKHGAKKLAKQLSTWGIPAVELHGNLSQNARERNLEAFAEGTCRVLVATDIAARGIHVDEIGLVVHVDPPAEHKAYLHRSGRTARAGNEGVVVTIMTPDQVKDVKALARDAKIEPTITRVAPGHTIITELAGPPAPTRHVAPVAAPVQARRQQPKQQQSRQQQSKQQPRQQNGQQNGQQSRQHNGQQSGRGPGQQQNGSRSGAPSQRGRGNGGRRVGASS
jgi:superfamily II DNA/RNA helicase